MSLPVPVDVPFMCATGGPVRQEMTAASSRPPPKPRSATHPKSSSRSKGGSGSTAPSSSSSTSASAAAEALAPASPTASPAAPAAPGAPGGRVQLLTLHGAKGLEFRVVLLVGGGGSVPCCACCIRNCFLRTSLGLSKGVQGFGPLLMGGNRLLQGGVGARPACRHSATRVLPPVLLLVATSVPLCPACQPRPTHPPNHSIDQSIDANPHIQVGCEDGLLPHAMAGDSALQRAEEKRLLFVGGWADWGWGAASWVVLWSVATRVAAPSTSRCPRLCRGSPLAPGAGRGCEQGKLHALFTCCGQGYSQHMRSPPANHPNHPDPPLSPPARHDPRHGPAVPHVPPLAVWAHIPPTLTHYTPHPPHPSPGMTRAMDQLYLTWAATRAKLRAARTRQLQQQQHRGRPDQQHPDTGAAPEGGHGDSGDGDQEEGAHSGGGGGGGGGSPALAATQTHGSAAAPAHALQYLSPFVAGLLQVGGWEGGGWGHEGKGRVAGWQRKRGLELEGMRGAGAPWRACCRWVQQGVAWQCWWAGTAGWEGKARGERTVRTPGWGSTCHLPAATVILKSSCAV